MGTAAGKDARLDRTIDAARSGDPAALDELYVLFADVVRQRIGRIVLDHHDAEDISQAVFARLPAALLRYERRRAPFAAWVRRVAENAALDHVRIRRPIPVEDVRETSEDSEELRNELLGSLRTAFEQLPEGQREVAVMRHIGGFSPGEIAQRLGRTESAVHALHHRGRRQLVTALQELHATPTTS